MPGNCNGPLRETACRSAAGVIHERSTSALWIRWLFVFISCLSRRHIDTTGHAHSICLPDYFCDRDGGAFIEHIGNDFIGCRFFDECRYRTRRLDLHVVGNLGHTMVERAAEDSRERE